VAEREKVEAPVHCAATSIRVELSRFGEVKELLGDYVMNASPRQSLESILIKRLYKKKGQRSRSWKGMVMRILLDFPPGVNGNGDAEKLTIDWAEQRLDGAGWRRFLGGRVKVSISGITLYKYLSNLEVQISLRV